QEYEIWSGLAPGTTRLQIGTTTNSTMAATPGVVPSTNDGTREIRAAPAGSVNGTKAIGASVGGCFILRFNGPALQREESLRPLLNEEDDEHEHRNLCEH